MNIKVMADYGCHPLWADNDPDRMGDIDPAELDLSEGLRQALAAWAERFDAILIQDDPASSAFASPEAELTFHEDGRMLARRVAHELGALCNVRYWRDPPLINSPPQCLE